MNKDMNNPTKYLVQQERGDDIVNLAYVLYANIEPEGLTWCVADISGELGPPLPGREKDHLLITFYSEAEAFAWVQDTYGFDTFFKVIH